MKFNFEKKPGVNTTNKKEVAKHEEQKRKQYSAVVRSADYAAQREKVDAPFGKVVKKTIEKSKKDYSRKNKDY